MNAIIGEIDSWDRIEGVPDPLESRRVIGHDAILDRLCDRFAGGRMHHAWLLGGPRGIGKATLAARFAGHVFRNPDANNAPRGYVAPPASDPVEARIGHGAHPNLLYMRRPWNDRDRKWRTELTVDEIRRTVSFFGNASAEEGWRVAIVDSADDLNASAANALLKILEEPPPRTLFLILASSPKGALPTIRSRCQKLVVRALGHEDLVAALRLLPPFTDTPQEELAMAADLAGGSVRRAILILNESGADLYRRFAQLSDVGAKPNWTAIHDLAGELSLASRSERYQLFLDLVHDHIARKIRDNADALAGESASARQISALAGLADVWEKTRRSAERTDAYNLDRKQVILNLFTAIHAMA